MLLVSRGIAAIIGSDDPSTNEPNGSIFDFRACWIAKRLSMEVTLIFNDGKRRSHSIFVDILPDFIEVPLVSRDQHAEKIAKSIHAVVIARLDCVG
jgi:hypothetical protein